MTTDIFSRDGFAFVYHEVCKKSDLHLTGRQINPLKWFIEPHIFEQHIRFIKEQNIEITRVDQNYKKKSRRNPEKYVFLTFDDGGISNYESTYPILERHSIKGHFFLVTDLVNTSRFMKPSMIKEMAESGHHIGSHSKSHRFLRFLNDSELDKELDNSKKYIEDITGIPCVSLSIPSGLVTNRIIKKAYDMGYKNIFTSEPMILKKISASRNLIGRWNINQNQSQLQHILNKDFIYITKKKIRYIALKTIQNAFSGNYDAYQKISLKVNSIYERKRNEI